MLVVHRQLRQHAVLNDAGTKRARRVAAHLAAEQELDSIGATEVEILAQQLLEELAPVKGPIEDLGEAHLDLPDGEPVAVSGGAVVAREWMGQTSEPAAKEFLDVLGRELIAQSLQLAGIGAGQKIHCPAPRRRCRDYEAGTSPT